MSDLISFAYQYISFLMGRLSLEEQARIHSVILFGSTARKQGGYDSDIDLFIESRDKRMKKLVARLTTEFYDAELYKRYWRSRGIKNEIHPICDELKNWPSLRQSIVNDGQVLYGKYTAPLNGGTPLLLIWWDPILNQTKRVLMAKQLFGWTLHGKKVRGLLTKSDKLGPNTVMVPLEQSTQVQDLLKKQGIPFRQKLMNKIE